MHGRQAPQRRSRREDRRRAAPHGQRGTDPPPRSGARMSIAPRSGGHRLRGADRSASARRGRRGDPQRPLRVVALGGGHGLAANLRALRLLADDITAVVTVADNGGRRGRLGVPPRPLRVVALGGGHGLAANLRALRLLADDITAVVTVADNGGSSGRIRTEMPVLPPGDLRMALAALCEDSDWGSIWGDV